MSAEDALDIVSWIVAVAVGIWLWSRVSSRLEVTR